MDERVAIPPHAARKLAALHRERAEVDGRATAYLTGLTDALGVDLARVSGVDDASNELILLPEVES